MEKRRNYDGNHLPLMILRYGYLFLASAESSYITGIELFVDGGMVQV
jgi:NAD(P)-dependent dehydrogenase (short-subunit alcohol dehydrogenase family)